MNAQSKVAAAPGRHVYAAIAAVQGELATVGIAKTRKNQQGSGYMFRGIDDVYGALSPLLAKHSLVIVPRIVSRELVERASKNGGALFYVTVHAEFDFVSALDGSIHVAATFGEAMDSGDKATNKAMSAAYKYAAFMTFAIPTEGDNDADGVTHEVAAAPPRKVAVPVKAVSDDQFATLIQLIQASGTDTQAFCAHYKADSVATLAADKFDNAVAALKKKIAAAPPPKQAAPADDILEDSIPY